MGVAGREAVKLTLFGQLKKISFVLKTNDVCGNMIIGERGDDVRNEMNNE